MAFYPVPGASLVLGGREYRVAEHPAAPGMPYGQEGRQAVVYQLLAGEERVALKVFKPRFRDPGQVSLADKLAGYADLPGLRVCRRTVLSAQRHGVLLQEYPDLIYCVVMPWIEGPTWMQVVLERRALQAEGSLGLARELARVLARMSGA